MVAARPAAAAAAVRRHRRGDEMLGAVGAVVAAARDAVVAAARDAVVLRVVRVDDRLVAQVEHGDRERGEDREPRRRRGSGAGP